MAIPVAQAKWFPPRHVQDNFEIVGLLTVGGQDTGKLPYTNTTVPAGREKTILRARLPRDHYAVIVAIGNTMVPGDSATLYLDSNPWGDKGLINFSFGPIDRPRTYVIGESPFPVVDTEIRVDYKNENPDAIAAVGFYLEALLLRRLP